MLRVSSAANEEIVMTEMFEDMMLGGEIIRIQVTTLPIEELELDPTNPRIQYRLSLVQDRDNLDDVILNMSEVKELKKDIEGNGGLRERPYVQFNQQTQKFKVIEGNCRTVCIRDLHHRYTADARWSHVPVRVFPETLSGRQIAIFLSDQHVSGKIPWKAHEQAGQIYRMHVEHGMSTVEIARYLRITAGKVETLYKAYEFMIDRFVRIDSGKYAQDGEGKFSYFNSALNRKGIREAFAKDDNLANDFCHWVGNNRFPKSNDVVKLDKILNHPEAMNAWKNGASLDETMKIVADLDPTTRTDQPIFKHLQQVQDDCGDLQISAIEEFASDEKARQLFAETRNEINKVIEMIERSASPMRQAAE
jgi:hypothetical protein